MVISLQPWTPVLEMPIRLQGLLRGLLFLAMPRKIFQTSKPACLSASVTGAADRELVQRFKAHARAFGVSVQRLLLLGTRRFLDASDN